MSDKTDKTKNKFGRKTTIDEVLAVLYQMAGGNEEVLNAMLKSYRVAQSDSEKPTYKYGDYSLSQLETILNAIGGKPVVEKIRSGDYRAVVTCEELVKTLIDHHGRVIPHPSLKENNLKVVDADYAFYPDQVEMIELCHFEYRLERLIKYFKDAGIEISIDITAKQFMEETLRQREAISKEADGAIANLIEGCNYPLVLPKIKGSNYGAILESYLKALEKVYLDAFGEFDHFIIGSLSGQVKIMDKCYHNSLIALRKGFRVVQSFPTALQGYSVLAASAQMEYLPDTLCLFGLDVIIERIMYTEEMTRGMHTPGYDLAALQHKPSGRSLYFGATDDGLYFVYGGSLADANNGCSGGVCFIG